MAKSKSIAARRPNGQATMVPATEQESLFGPPPLIPGEDPADYQRLAARVSAGVEPRGILEEIWVRDVVDLLWDTLRSRRLKANLLQAEAHDGIRFTIGSLMEDSLGASELSRAWARREPEALKLVKGLLNLGDLTMDSVMATTLGRNLDKIERIDRLLASAEARRNNALREIDRHRAALGAALRAASENVEDVEFTDVETAETVGVQQ